MLKSDVYKLLEEKMLTCAELMDVPIKPCGEALVPIEATPHLTARQLNPAMVAVTGEAVYVREGVFERLVRGGELLGKVAAGSSLEVVYGYRSLAIQQARFEEVKAQLQDKHEGQDLIEATHRWVALPDVAGHPTGGAVDVRILDPHGNPLEMGTDVWAFIQDSYTYSPFISREAWRNRQLLDRTMQGVDFAPFDGEWWHYSFGDREWAAYYDQPAAIYEPTEFQSLCEVQ